MINLLVNAIFWVITTLANTIFNPIFSAIFALFPDLATFFNYISTFLNEVFSVVVFGRDFMLIPQSCFVMLFDYYAIKYSIYVIQQGLKFTVKVYNTFKP